MGSRRELVWVEATRTLAMAAVVLGHVNNFWYFSAGIEAWWSVVISVAIRCVVPAFFMISGFLLGRGLGSPGRTGGGFGWWRRKLDVLVVPFLAWNVIYMVWFGVFQGRPVWSGLTLWNLATGYDHLYFVFVLLQFFGLWALVRDHLNERRLRMLLIWSAILSGLFYLVSDALLWLTGPDGHFFEWTFGKVFVGWGL
ncbi:MAG: acyltransferase, partial [Proteobacteria bacterium]|nr:acyltransferase [Pseudomonadota bacterium]